MISFKRFLQEAYNVKKFYGKKLSKTLRSIGWEPIGEGAFASVWKIPGKSYVVKLWTKDSAYESFLKYIIRNKNPHYPKVTGRVKNIPAFYPRATKQEMLKVVKLEPLKPISFYNYRMVRQVLDIDLSLETKQKWFAVHSQAQSLYDAFMDVAPFLHGDIDIHSGNVMERADGTIVLIDPCADDDELTELNNTLLMKDEYFKPSYLERDVA